MNLFSKPERVEASDVVLCTVTLLLECCLAPASMFEHQNMNWFGGLVIVFPVTFFAGWLVVQRNHAFYIHACWALIGGAVAWPFCLLVRPVAANFAFVVLTSGAGPVAVYHLLRRSTKSLQTIAAFANRDEASFAASLLKAHGFGTVLIDTDSAQSDSSGGAILIQLQVPERQAAKATNFLKEAGAEQRMANDESRSHY